MTPEDRARFTTPTADIGEAEYVTYTLWTDTRTYRVIRRTPCSMTLQATSSGPTLVVDHVGGNPWPCTYTEAVRDDDAPTSTARLRQNGRFYLPSADKPLRPAQMLDGKPFTYTDYRE